MAEDENAAWLFGGDQGDGGLWEAQRRFISSDFNAIYRQGVVGPRHLKEADFARFLSFAREGDSLATEQFRTWYLTDRVEGGDYGDVAMDRIGARAHTFDAQTACGVVRVFAQIMDEYYRARPKREMFYDTWQQSEAILRSFRSSVDDYSLSMISPEIAASGTAVAWMSTCIVRGELWRHGLAGDQKDEGARQLTVDELRDFTTTLIGRLSRMTRTQLLELPQLGGVLYTVRESPWNADDAVRIIRRLGGPRVSDANFLEFLEAMSSVVISSNRGAYFKISPKSVGGLIGEEEFTRRWDRIQRKALPDEIAGKRAEVERRLAESKQW